MILLLSRPLPTTLGLVQWEQGSAWPLSCWCTPSLWCCLFSSECVWAADVEHLGTAEVQFNSDVAARSSKALMCHCTCSTLQWFPVEIPWLAASQPFSSLQTVRSMGGRWQLLSDTHHPKSLCAWEGKGNTFFLACSCCDTACRYRRWSPLFWSGATEIPVCDAWLICPFSVDGVLSKPLPWPRRWRQYPQWSYVLVEGGTGSSLWSLGLLQGRLDIGKEWGTTSHSSPKAQLSSKSTTWAKVSCSTWLCWCSNNMSAM